MSHAIPTLDRVGTPQERTKPIARIQAELDRLWVDRCSAASILQISCRASGSIVSMSMMSGQSSPRAKYL